MKFAKLATLLAPLATILVIFVAWSYFVFGSIASGFYYLNGAVVEVESVDVGSLVPGETVKVDFDVKNLTKKPVGILGIHTSCGCALVGGLPTTLPSRGQSEISLEFTLGGQESSGPFMRNAVLIMDTESAPAVLSIRGSVI